MYPIQVTAGFTGHRGADFVPATDFRLSDHGSIWILSPTNDQAEDWIADNVSTDRMGWGVKGIAIEARFIADIVHGIQGDGLSVGA